MPSDRRNVPSVTGRSRRSRAVRRRDRMLRSVDATGSLAVVGALLATGMVAGALQSASAKPSDADSVHLSVAEPSNAAAVRTTPRPTKTIYKTVLVTPTPKPQASGNSSGQSSSGSSGSSGSSRSSGSGSSWKPKKSPTPVATHSTAPAPQPKPSASSSGS